MDALDHLDHGHVRDAIARIDRAPSDVAGRLWRAELLVYLDRADDAAAEIDALAELLDARQVEATTTGECARRRMLLAAEVAYLGGQLDEATRLVDEVARVADMVDDERHAMRAAYDMGRILRRRGEYAASLEALLVAASMADRLENAYYAGLVGYNRAICCYELGDYDRLDEYLARARAELEASERLRYFGLSENLRGLVMTETGRVDEGLAVLAGAERIAASLGIRSDLLAIASNVGRASIGAGRYAEADRGLAGLVDTAHPEAFTRAEFYPLCLMAVARCLRGDVRGSHRAARLALELAHKAGSDDDRFEASLLVMRARGLEGEDEAIDALRALVGEADAHGTEAERAHARIYLAHALVADSPVEATALCREARALGVLLDGHWLRTELERVEESLARAPIHVDARGRLIIDTSLAWPTIKAAREATERFIFDRAMEATGGNASAAGRRIGESRYQMHHLGRVLRGEAPRPSRSKDPDAQNRKPKRRRSRISFS